MEAQSCLAEAITASGAAERIRILFDARKLGDGGIGVYAENSLLGLSKRGDIELTVIIDPAKRQLFNELALPNTVNVLEDSTKPYSISELFRFPDKEIVNRYDLFHTPHYVLPFGIRIPTIITVHDLIHITHPEKAYYPIIARPLISSALNRAAQIITVSQFSKDAIEKLSPKASSKLHVIPNAISQNLDSKIEVDFEMLKPFVLCVASNSKPHKGLKQLISAFNSFKAKFPEYSLVMVGAGSTAFQGVPGIQCLGQVTNQELSSLYRAASFLAVPSRVEGFCFPVIEAKFYGVPVVASPAGAILELLDSGDVLASDFSEASLALALEQAVKSESTRSSQFPRDKYSIESTTDSLVSVYRSALSRSNLEAQ